MYGNERLMHVITIDPIAFSLDRSGALVWHYFGDGGACRFDAGDSGRQTVRDLSPDFFMDLLLIGVPSAIVGARIYYVAFKWDDYKDNLMEVFKIWHGGIAIYGALIGAIICGDHLCAGAKGTTSGESPIFAHHRLIVGQMIGRWGNFMNQEAHGGPVTRAFLRDTLHLPNLIVNQMNVEGVLSSDLSYESLWNLLGLVILFVLRRQPFLRAGEHFSAISSGIRLDRFF